VADSTEDNYFLEIEAHFAMRRNTPFILNAKDWALMQKWREEGVPLPVVIEAIDSVFEKNETSARRKVISSLSYCKHAVKELWEDRKQLQVGAEGSTPEENPADLLEALASEIPDDAIAEKVRALASEKSVPAIEEKLMAVEQELIARLLASLSSADSENVQAEIRRVMAGAKLDEKTAARTIEAHRRRIIREKFGLPRLTLFR
jgi:hypothetical protein